MRFANPLLNAKFDQAIDVLTENTTTMGIEEMVIERIIKQYSNQWIKEIREKVIQEGIEQGLEQGIEQGKEKNAFTVVKNLLMANRFTIAEIANFANVTEAFVLKVKETL